MSKTAEKIRVPQLEKTNFDVKPELYVVKNRTVNTSKQVERQDKINEEFLLHVLAILISLKPNQSYTLRSMCGDAFWSRFNAFECRVAGRYISLLVAEGTIPLETLNSKNSSNHNRYLLK
jgi:hypothetical protein